MFGKSRKRHGLSLVQMAAQCEEIAADHRKVYERTGDRERLAAYRLHAADAEAYRRGVDPHKQGMPEDLARKWRYEESRVVARQAMAERYGS